MRSQHNLHRVPFSSKLALGIALGSLSLTAFSQSGVTLFGVADLGARVVTNSAGTTQRMYSGNNSTSRWGMRGEEDLGGGMKVGFWLESTVNLTDGTTTSSQFFDRRSTLSFSGRFGEVRLGRDYTPAFRGYGTTEVFDFSGSASMITLFNGSASTVLKRAFGGKTSSNGRANGAVQYFTPNTLGGFNLSAMYANSGEGSVSGDFDYKGLRVGYENGPWNVTAFGGVTNIKSVGENYRIRGAAINYRTGGAKLVAGVVDMRYFDSRQTNYTVGAVWPFGLHQIKATWHHINQAGSNTTGGSIGRDDADLFALGYVYNLSKRTALYGTLAYLKNKGRASFGITGGAPGAEPGSTSHSYELGLRHTF
ncbi:porin [Ottowia sp. VDI28]|uniref:porin n=1 Tax=Ottowia sp. VDI28 TaxID=3133968 RepID=UPI003C2F8009